MWKWLWGTPADHRARTIALAGVIQAARLVQRIARHGNPDPHLMEVSVRSILALDAPDCIAIFGGAANLREGLQEICPLLQQGPANPGQAELLRHVLALLTLAKRLQKRPDLTERIRKGVEQAQRQLQHFGDPLHPSIIAGLAETYTEAVSPLPPRIVVTGDAQILTQPEQAARIRTILLGGLRAAVLWRQKGGGSGRLLVERASLCAEAKAFLARAGG